MVVAEQVSDPAQFATLTLGLKLPVVSKVQLRRLTNEGERISFPKTRFKVQEARRAEIAAALWHLLARPDQDVVVAVNYGSARDAWLMDVGTVLKQSQAVVQREVAVYQGGVITRFLGTGRLMFWVAGGKDACRPTDLRGDRPLLIMAGFDSIPGEQTLELLKRFAPPSSILVSTYDAS